MLERRGIVTRRVVSSAAGARVVHDHRLRPGVDGPGYDFVAQAETGWMAITGEPDGDPMKIGVALADVLAGKDAAIAILAARDSARPDGVGGRAFISLADSARAALVNVAQNALVSGRRREDAGATRIRISFRISSFAPPTGRSSSRSGATRSGAPAPARSDWPSLADDPALATNAGRLAQRERIVTEFSRALATEPAAGLARAARCRGSSERCRANGSRGAAGNEWLGGDGNAVERWRRGSFRSAGPRRARRSDSPSEAWDAFSQGQNEPVSDRPIQSVPAPLPRFGFLVT